MDGELCTFRRTWWNTPRTKLLPAVASLALLAGSAGAPAATGIVVTTTSDALNGDTATVAGLLADPGADGISLREAIEATNNDPGSYTIRFAPALRGKAIVLTGDLPPLTGGGVTIDGSGVSLRTTVTSTWCECALQIASSRNRLHGLTVEGFRHGILIGPNWDWTRGGSLPTQVTLAHNVVEGLVMRDIGAFGVFIWSVFSPYCGAPKQERCWSYTTWTNTAITGNTIETGDTGIAAKIGNAGDRVERLTVIGNTIRIAGEDQGIGLETGGDSARARISDVLIARNTIEGSVDIGINVASGTIRGQSGIVERVRVLDNRVHLTESRAMKTRGYCCAGIVVQAGSDSPDFAAMVQPPRFLDGNLTRDVLVRGNVVSGTLDTGVSVNAGSGGGGRRNRVEEIRIERNTIRTSKPGIGVGISTGGGTPRLRPYATGNRVSAVTVDANRVTIGKGGFPENAGGGEGAGGVVIAAGGNASRGNDVRNVRITRNAIATAYVGVRVVGGVWPTARGNSVSCVRLAGNRITGARRAVSVVANHRGATGNRATLGGC